MNQHVRDEQRRGSGDADVGAETQATAVRRGDSCEARETCPKTRFAALLRPTSVPMNSEMVVPLHRACAAPATAWCKTPEELAHVLHRGLPVQRLAGEGIFTVAGHAQLEAVGDHVGIASQSLEPGFDAKVRIIEYSRGRGRMIDPNGQIGVNLRSPVVTRIP